MPTLSVCATAPIHGISNRVANRRPEIVEVDVSFMSVEGVSQADEISYLFK
jgi:hypothetical protein